MLSFSEIMALADRVRTASTVSTLREPAFRIIDRMQDINPSDQVRALMLAAVVVCEALRLDPHEEVHRSRRMIAQAEGPFTHHVQAIRSYAEGELSRKEVA